MRVHCVWLWWWWQGRGLPWPGLWAGFAFASGRHLILLALACLVVPLHLDSCRQCACNGLAAAGAVCAHGATFQPPAPPAHTHQPRFSAAANRPPLIPCPHSIYLAHIERTHLRPLIVAATAGAEGPPSHSAAATHSLGTRTTSSRGLLTALAVAAGEGSCLLSGGAAGSAGVLGPLGSPPGSSQRVAAPLQQAVAATLQLTPPAGGTRAAGAVTPAAPAAAAAIAEQQPGCGLGPYRASLLLRLVDDFLLVTSVPGVAAAVAERMLQGGCWSVAPAAGLVLCSEWRAVVAPRLGLSGGRLVAAKGKGGHSTSPHPRQQQQE